MKPNSIPRQTTLIFRRTARDGVRNFPLAFVAPTLLAGFVAAIFAAVFNSVADTPGFPTATFIEWMAPGAVLLSAFVGAGYAASALLRDIETGYLDRLRLLPIHPAAIVTGRAAFEGVRIIFPASAVLAVTLMLGAHNGNGVIGFVAVIAITVIVAVAWNGIFFMVAITTKNPQTVLGLQPLFMPVIMFSTFFAPIEGAPGWFNSISSVNPFTPLLDGTRSILADSTNAGQLAIGLGLFVLLGVATYTVAARAFAGLVTAN